LSGVGPPMTARGFHAKRQASSPGPTVCRRGNDQHWSGEKVGKPGRGHDVARAGRDRPTVRRPPGQLADYHRADGACQQTRSGGRKRLRHHSIQSVTGRSPTSSRTGHNRPGVTKAYRVPNGTQAGWVRVPPSSIPLASPARTDSSPVGLQGSPTASRRHRRGGRTNFLVFGAGRATPDGGPAARARENATRSQRPRVSSVRIAVRPL